MHLNEIFTAILWYIGIKLSALKHYSYFFFYYNILTFYFNEFSSDLSCHGIKKYLLQYLCEYFKSFIL